MRTFTTLLLSIPALAVTAQQWELVTPIKSRSSFHDIQMLDEQVAYAVDKPMGAILRTNDGGHIWERRWVNYFNDPMTILILKSMMD